MLQDRKVSDFEVSILSYQTILAAQKDMKRHTLMSRDSLVLRQNDLAKLAVGGLLVGPDL